MADPPESKAASVSRPNRLRAWLVRTVTVVFTAAGARYPLIFTAVFFGLLLLPLQGFRGDITSLDTSFWGYQDLLRATMSARFYLLHDRIFGETVARQTDVAQQPGWLAYTGEDSLDEYQNAAPFTQAQLAKIQKNLDGLNERLNAQSIHLLVVFVPGKNTVYPEYMPPEIPKLRPQTRLDQILETMKNSPTPILDLRPALAAARQERQVYYATDTHWNPYGIYVGYSEIINALAEDSAKMKSEPHRLEEFRYISQGQGAGDLSRRWFQGAIQEEQFRLEPTFKRQSSQFAIVQGSSNLPGRMIASYNPDAKLPSAMVIHDSFFNDMIPFLGEHFRWAIFHWAVKVDETFVAGEKPDIVILEVTDRYLSRLLTITK